MLNTSRFNRIIKFLKSDIWRIPVDEFPPVKKFFLRQLQVFMIAIRGLYEDKVYQQASALTFLTLLSIVPLFAMAFGIASGFGFEKYLEAELARVFAGREEVMEWIMSFTRSMLEATRGGLMAGAGLLFLFYTAMKMFGHIESSFNEIWQIKKSRSYSRKLADYLSVILIAPVFIIVANLFTVFFTARIDQLITSTTVLEYLSPLIMYFFRLIPYILIWVVFTIIYMVMPNTRVRFSSALLAGVIAGTLFQLVQWGYIHFQIGVSRYNAIYGSFAALPLLLMWMQVSWTVVLFGAEISFANQNIEKYEFESETKNMSMYNRRLVSLIVMHLLVKNFQEGLPPATASELSRKLQMPVRLVREVLHKLTEIKVVSEVRTQYDRETAFQPAVDINMITVKYVSDKLDHRGKNILIAKNTDELEKLKSILESFSLEAENNKMNKLLKDI